MNRFMFAACSLNLPLFRFGDNCFISTTKILEKIGKSPKEWDNHGYIYKFDPMTNKYGIQATGLPDDLYLWLDASDFDMAILDRDKFATNIKMPKPPLKLELDGFAIISINAIRDIAKSIMDRDECFVSRIVKIDKYHEPTDAYRVYFYDFYSSYWVNAEELTPTDEKWEIKDREWQEEDPL